MTMTLQLITGHIYKKITAAKGTMVKKFIQKHVFRDCMLG